MMKGKTLTRAFCTILVLLLFGLIAFEARAEKRVVLITYSEEGFYLKSQKGLLELLSAEGFGTATVNLSVENAQGSKSKASELVQKYAAEKPDLLITLGTSVTIFALKAIRDLPVVFSTVYDPIEAGIAKDWASSGNNCTGASTKIPPTKILELVREFTPIKTLGVLYTPGEMNSESQLRGLQDVQASSGIKILPIILARKDEIPQILPEVVNAVDAVYLTGSTIVGGSVPAIVEIANKAGVLSISHLDDLVEKGAVLGICTNSYLVGRLAGEKAVQVLRGADPSTIPIESGKEIDIILNRPSATAGKFQIPEPFLKKITKFIE